jgi:type I restriction enzyme S subunit
MNKYLKIDEVVKSVSITHKFDRPLVKFLNTSDVENGKIININYLPLNELKGQAKKTIKKNDILFSEIRPKNRRYAYVDIDDTDDFVVSTKLMVLRNVNPEVDNKYFYYYLTNDHMLSVLQDRAENRIGSFPQITFDLLSEYSLRVPQLTEQKKISKILSDLDSKIELNNQINAELEDMAKTIYDYWFVQFDFPDENGKPYKSSGGKMVWNEELKREIPEGWKVSELKDIANITMGQSPPGESYNEIGEGMIFYQGCTDFGNRFPTVRKFTTEPTRLAKEGDILLSVRAPVGTLNISKEDCCIGRGLAALNSKDNCVSYLFGVMVNLKQIFDRRNVNGTTFGSITKDDLFSLWVIMPVKSILNQYHSIINPAFEKQNKLELENQKLFELRDWLLPMLMNGQVKVN